MNPESFYIWFRERKRPQFELSFASWRNRGQIIGFIDRYFWRSGQWRQEQQPDFREFCEGGGRRKRENEAESFEIHERHSDDGGHLQSMHRKQWQTDGPPTIGWSETTWNSQTRPKKTPDHQLIPKDHEIFNTGCLFKGQNHSKLRKMHSFIRFKSTKKIN